MNTVIIATKNKGKASEFAAIFSEYGIETKTLLDYPSLPDVEETGETFEENAVLKAEAISKQTGTLVIADDSGLVVDALSGRPGVYSARYAGEQKDDEANIQKVLTELKGVPDEKRTARFYCALAVAMPGKETVTVFGTCEGRIIASKRGTNGFGYDPIFFVDDLNKTLAELKSDEKNSISHRGEAIKKLKAVLPDLLGGKAQ
ncbi:XTP/dITP diphosphatase [Bacillus thermotolerans]|uniref:dITP/XTP pyrophosphatase n=1 Tax=Bacillus thermotolerans TaxID=1221996 RepID=A0A0F5IDF2_BACTR|nr:XTP/dITP diphosphatase [Bacillus thermotolerans]KKB43380.1 Nucleoside 5-triphosphatase RdgB [Bacillus thermotolerans]KKB43499.1 Nucleoside 5-triphosphatase RdgB [Bacillus thermotolerans]